MACRSEDFLSSTIQTIGIANGGGDCPGLNAVIRGAVRAAILQHGWKVIGINDGFDGLIWTQRTVPLTIDSVAGILPRGGTILGTTNRGNPFHYGVEEAGEKITHDFSLTCCENARRLGLDALIAIGGDGTLTIARDLYRLGIPIVGVPKTIDNDISATEFTFGFDTALHVATDAIDRLHTTAESHGRVMVVEVMGRDAGWIALHSGMAGGADVILLPEIPFSIDVVCAKLRERAAMGRKFSLVVVAEGVTMAQPAFVEKRFPARRPGQVGIIIGDAIHAQLKQDVRVTVLGHIQRGGSPSPFDRILATRFGVEAVELIARGEFGRMVCLHANEIESVTLDEAVGVMRGVDPKGSMVRTARAVGITFGDY
jgi:6-phosphofructokinase 1